MTSSDAAPAPGSARVSHLTSMQGVARFSGACVTARSETPRRSCLIRRPGPAGHPAIFALVQIGSDFILTAGLA